MGAADKLLTVVCHFPQQPQRGPFRARLGAVLCCTALSRYQNESIIRIQPPVELAEPEELSATTVVLCRLVHQCGAVP